MSLQHVRYIIKTKRTNELISMNKSNDAAFIKCRLQHHFCQNIYLTMESCGRRITGDMIYCVSHSSETIVGHPVLLRQSTADLNDESAQTRKLNGSSAETPSYQNLHRELLLSHKRYCGPHVHTLTGDLFLRAWDESSRMGFCDVTLGDCAEACCWRRNPSWSECWSSADWSCTRRRRWHSGVPQTWRQSSARGSRSWRRYRDANNQKTSYSGLNTFLFSNIR